ncbi:hypothetical protein [Frigoriglobus tundricola]|uniref:hypothetical protein n=1 Tax=Frigoriglobus tundricola TaxID=2774151 RepID=UPI00148EAA02|nr:hypothetical protein [Frigoriglobus tundricola]
MTYHEKHTGDAMLPDEDEKTLIAALIVISIGVTDANKLGVAADAGRRLLECYDGLTSGGLATTSTSSYSTVPRILHATRDRSGEAPAWRSEARIEAFRFSVLPV